MTFDGRVLLFTLGATTAAALLFGLAPALQTSRPDLQSALKDRGSVSPDERRRRVRSVLVVGEVALSMVLLVGAGLTFRSFLSLQRADLGFVPDGVQTFRLSLPFQKYPQARQRADLYAELESEIRTLPGVTSVGASSVLPLTGRFWTSPFATKDSEEDAWSVNEANYRMVTPGYLPTMKTRLVHGRLFTRADEYDSARVAIVDRAMAERAWPNRKAVGQWLQVELSFAGVRDWVEVVGVVENVRWENPGRDDRPTVYFPHLYQGGFPLMNVAVRTKGKPTAVMGMIREVVGKLDADLPVAGVRAMDAYVSDALAPMRFTMLLISIFAAAALALATVGLYGVISSSVKQRTREIGVHMAFGADRSQVLRMVLRRGLQLSVSGVVVGLAASAALGRVFERTLAGVTAADPATFGAVAGLLTIVALVASVLPAHRATRVDPMVALRYE
ncbi:MAG: FtsX-like permease family protein [Gemmatimonadota bacterium]